MTKTGGHRNLKLIDTPMVEISSSFIRKAVRSGKEIQYYLPQKVYDHILEMYFYE